MTAKNVRKLSNYTKLFIFVLTVIATEIDSHSGLYFAMLCWLFIDYVIKAEKSILDYIETNFLK